MSAGGAFRCFQQELTRASRLFGQTARSSPTLQKCKPQRQFCTTCAPRFSYQFPRRESAAKTRSATQPERRSSGRRPAGRLPLYAAGGGVLGLLLASVELAPSSNHDDDKHASTVTTTPIPEVSEQHDSTITTTTDDNSGLPLFRLSEVKEHDGKSEHPWVVHGDKVYDITEWVGAHPGGEVILRAAGGRIEPYWDIFAIHKQQYVRDILEQYVIGRLHPDDLAGGVEHIDDPFETDPHRDPSLRVLTAKPCNAETPRDGLADSFFTPNDLFYVRNHMWVPVVEDPEEHEISVELPDGDIKTYTIRELKERFKMHTVTSVMQCSGNRRKHMTDGAKKTNGLQWTIGAISCAKWEGVRLRDVLADAGLPMDEPDEDAQHVQFSGAEAYGASIPIAAALDPRGDVLLAFRMNDEPLPRDHGFPCRVIVPGHVAARCVKWLKKIVISDEESLTSWQRRDYKCFGPNEVTQDWDKYKAIQKMPVTSAITRATLKQRVSTDMKPEDPETVQLEGYAYSGGGHEIQRVDVSLDSGKTWDQASFVEADEGLEQGHQSWCWKRWRYEGPLPEGDMESADGQKNKNKERKTTFVVKATDEAYNTQPETHSSIYNLRGNLATAWHRLDFHWGDGKGTAGTEGKASSQ